MANENHSEAQPSEIVGRVPIGAQPNATELLEPTNSALNVPSELAQAAPAWGAPLGEQWLDMAPPQFCTVSFVIVATIPLQAVGAMAWPTDLASDGWHCIDQRNRLFDVVAVARGQVKRQWHAAGIGEQVDLTARLAPIDGTWAGFRTRAEGTQVATVDQKTAEIDALVEAEPIEEQFMDAWPYAGQAPPPQAPPARHTATATHLLWEVFPGDTCFQNEQNAGENFAVIDGWPSAFGSRRMRRQIRANGFPKMIRQQWTGHEAPPLAMQLTPEERFRHYYIDPSGIGQGSCGFC
jgi:hypothetical protein